MTKKKKRNRLVYIYVILLVVLLLVIYLLPKVNDQMTKTIMAEHGSLSISDNVTGYVIRNEKVYTSGYTGNTKYKVDEGTKVRKMAIVMEVAGEKDAKDTPKFTKLIGMLDNMDIRTTEYRAGLNGVLSYSIDGYEGMLCPDKMDELKESDVSGIVDDFTNLKKERVAEGEPVYKVYDNSKWYLVAWVSQKAAEKYKKGNGVTIRFKDAEVSASVYGKKLQEDGKVRIIISSDRYYAKLAVSRTEEVKIITKERTGLIVDNTCIQEKDGISGVYVRDITGEYVFVPINILLSTDKQSVISEGVYYDADGQRVSTVDLYDEILRNP